MPNRRTSLMAVLLLLACQCAEPRSHAVPAASSIPSAAAVPPAATVPPAPAAKPSIPEDAGVTKPLPQVMGMEEARLWSFQQWTAGAGSPGDASPSHEPPAELRRIWPRLSQLGEGCGPSGALQLAGPWEQPEERLWAAVLWKEGDDQACLALLRETPSSVAVVARSRIVAGNSDRYQEFYAPSLKPVLLRLPGRRLALTVDATAMGQGGGGGDVTRLYLVDAGSFREVLRFTLDSTTNINTFMETQSSSCSGEVEFHPWQQEAWLEVRACLDGEPSLQWYRFDGQQFASQPEGPPLPKARGR